MTLWKFWNLFIEINAIRKRYGVNLEVPNMFFRIYYHENNDSIQLYTYLHEITNQ